MTHREVLEALSGLMLVLFVVGFAYGDATGHIFAISAAIGVVGVIAALLLKPIKLRSSLDLPEPAKKPTVDAVAAR
jgi:hypothetical protein